MFVKVFVTLGVYFKISTWKLVDQDFWFLFSLFNKIYLRFLAVIIAQIQNSNPQYSDTETNHLEMLIYMHICLFLMSYDSSNMGLGHIETIVLHNESKEMYCDLSLGKLDF